MSTPQPVSTAIPNVQRKAVAMFGILLAAYAVNAMDRMVFPVLLPDVRLEYGFGLGAAGLQSTMFALGMGVTGIPAGWLVAKLPRKHIVVAGTLLFSAATLLTVVSLGFVDMLIWRVLSGVGEALQLTAILSIAASAFTRHRGAAIGSVNMAFAAGSVIGPAVGGHLLGRLDTWRAPMIAFGVIGIVLAILVLTSVRRWFSESTAESTSQVEHVGGATRIWSRNPMILSAITVLFGLVDFGFIGMYASYLQEVLGHSAGEAGIIVGLSGLAAFASIVGGHLVDRVDPRTTLIWLNLLLAVSTAALFLGPSGLGWQGLWSFLFGLFASAGLYVVLAGCIVKSVHQQLAGRAAGLFVTSIYIPAGFAGFLFSLLVDLTSWTGAGIIQLGVFSLVGAALAMLLDSRTFSYPSSSESAGNEADRLGS